MKDLFIDSPAFPTDWTTDNRHSGISKRFYAACAAMQGMAANKNLIPNRATFEYIGKYAWDIADELLKQENENS